MTPAGGQALALAELQKAQVHFQRLAETAFHHQQAVDAAVAGAAAPATNNQQLDAKVAAVVAAQQQLAATQEALDLACISRDRAKAAVDAADAFCVQGSDCRNNARTTSELQGSD